MRRARLFSGMPFKIAQKSIAFVHCSLPSPYTCAVHELRLRSCTVSYIVHVVVAEIVIEHNVLVLPSRAEGRLVDFCCKQ